MASSKCVKNLGVIIDESLLLEKHISEVVKSCRYHLRELWRIRKNLTENTAKTIVHALIISKLDYCNSLYVNLPAILVAKLQSVLNETARLVTQTLRNNHITPALIQLHWLSVKERIDYKVLTMVYKGMNGLSPEYISELLTLREPCRQMRSSSGNLLF